MNWGKNSLLTERTFNNPFNDRFFTIFQTVIIVKSLCIHILIELPISNPHYNILEVCFALKTNLSTLINERA